MAITHAPKFQSMNALKLCIVDASICMMDSAPRLFWCCSSDSWCFTDSRRKETNRLYSSC